MNNGDVLEHEFVAHSDTANVVGTVCSDGALNDIPLTLVCSAVIRSNNVVA